MVYSKILSVGSLKSRLIFLSIFLIGFKTSFAQVFPVQANINVAPPYSVYLSHYTSSEQQKVMVNILLRDPVIPSIDVKFRFTIEGAGIKLTTNPSWNPAPTTITGGMLETLSQDIIADYLKPQHLLTEGVNPGEFFRSGKLPEGFYQFKVEVIEYRRNIVISNTGRAVLWLMLNEPPRIVFPLPGQKVMATNPQMLNFTWIPSGASSPLSSLTTQYEFTLVEMVDKSIDPNVAITTASNASKFVKITDQTNLFYGPGEMPLTPGKIYAIRVKAFTSDGLEMFKNGGYSEVRTFKFGDACNAPLSFTLKNPKQSQFDISVVTDPSNTAWQVRFRETSAGADLQFVPSNPDGGWSELKSEPGVSSKTPKGLKPKTGYEVQVKGLCGEIASDNIPSQTITTSPLADANRSCDGNATPFAADNAPALTKLSVNDFFLAALFPIKVTEVKSQAGGKFTGSGVATLPLFNVGLAVTFDNIGINNLMQLTSGEVKVVRNEFKMALIGETQDPPPGGGGGNGGGNNGGNGGGGDTISYPPITDTIVIPVEKYDSVKVSDNGLVTFYPPNGGTPVTVDLGGSSTTLLVPADGNMDNAKIVYDGAAHPYTPGQGGTNGANGQGGFSGYLANFRPHTGQVYGFDSMQYAPYTSFYNEMQINGKLIKLPWKALEMGKPDKVYLNIKRSNPNNPFTNLKVGVMGGADLLPSEGGDTPKRTYSLMGTAEGEEAIVATFQDSSKTKYAGGLWTATYQNKPFKVYLVPLPGIEISEAEKQTLQTELNSKIFSQAVVTWTVATLPGITGVNLGDNDLDWVDNTMLSSYNTEMNGVISTFKTWKPNAEEDAYYLFVVPKFSESGVEGFMPRNRRFGFITKEQVVMRTVAHELGHGAFNLKHTFPEVPQGSTKNLMDYSDGLALYKPQWDLIHNPEFTTGLWDDMEDGASKFTLNGYYLKPNGKPIYLPLGVSKVCFVEDNIKCPRGSLKTFELDKVMYSLVITIPKSSGPEDITFYGYRDKNNNYYPDKDVFKADEIIRLRKGIDIIGVKNEKLTSFIEGDYKTQTQYKYETVSDEEINKYFSNSKELITRPCDNCSVSSSTNDNNSSNISNLKDGGKIIDFSQGLLEDKSNLIKAVNDINSKFETSCIIYVINENHPDFERLLKQAHDDISTNKYIILVSGTKEQSTIKLEHAFTPPKWLTDLLPTYDNKCVVDYINIGLDELHKSDGYKSSSLIGKIKSEYSLAIYRGFFGLLYCSTSEESVKNTSSINKYFAGAIHELIATVDIKTIVDGLVELAKGIVKSEISSYDSYFKDVRQTFTDISNGNVLSSEELSKRLMPPSQRTQQKAIETIRKVGKELVHIYFDCSQGDPDKGINESLCPYRYGQLTVLIAPIVLTGGEYAIAKASAISTRLATKSLSKVDEVARMLKTAEEAGHTIERSASKIVIRDGDNITTIERKGSEVSILVKGVVKTKDELISLVDDAFKSYLRRDLDESSELFEFLKSNPDKLEAWKVLHKSMHSTNIKAINYVDRLKSNALLGRATNKDYLTTWRNEFPSLQGGGFNVHHSIEQQVLIKYPGLFDELEINSLENLRGISGEINPDIHLSRIRKEWDKFYDEFPAGTMPTRNQVLDHAKHVDDLYGNHFSPQIRIE